jgi:thiosulfate/3-mercaptopyruvate sulfurtransferase
VSTDWLQDHLGSLGLAIVDIRGYVKTTDLGGGRQTAEYTGARDEYDAGHIPGSAYVDWTVDIVDLDHPVKAQLAPPARFAEAMASRGVGDDTSVVLVDHTGGHFATRLWWALRHYGHNRAAVLDGGFAKWTVEGRPVTTASPAPARARFTARPRGDDQAEVDDVHAAIGDPGHLIVDARDVTQYTGEVRRGSRGGHIPGAVSIPAKSFVRDDFTWKGPE